MASNKKFSEQELDDYTEAMVSQVLNPPPPAITRRPQIMQRVMEEARRKKQAQLKQQI